MVVVVLGRLEVGWTWEEEGGRLRRAREFKVLDFVIYYMYKLLMLFPLCTLKVFRNYLNVYAGFLSLFLSRGL